jgi:hypothetical protein
MKVTLRREPGAHKEVIVLYDEMDDRDPRADGNAEL